MSRHRRRSSRHRLRAVTHKARPQPVPSTIPEEGEPQPGGGAATLQPAAECVDDRPSHAADESALERPGTMLRDAREARGLTLDDLTRITKVGKATLIALEASDVLRLPAAIYTRGFVKAYAGEVGLDPERTAETYLRGIQPSTIHHSSVDDGGLPPLLEAPATAKTDEGTRQLLMGNQGRRFGRVTTVAAVIGLIVYLVSFGRQRERQVPPTLTPVPTAVDAATASAPATRSTTTGGGHDAVTATLTGPLQIELTSQGPCWLVATVDGERVLARLLQPGERQTLAISEEAVLRIGDPSVLTISINGLSGRTLGRPGQPVNVTITKENFRDFLSS